MFVLKNNSPKQVAKYGKGNVAQTVRDTQIHRASDHKDVIINKPLDEMEKDLLVGYVVVPTNVWETIPYKSHVRYMKLDGTFVRGGFFKNHWTSKDGKSMMQLENNLNRKASTYATWAVALEGIKTLYKKCNKASAIEVTSMYKKIEHQRNVINNMVDAVNSIDHRVKLLERNLKTKQQPH